MAAAAAAAPASARRRLRGVLHCLQRADVSSSSSRAAAQAQSASGGDEAVLSAAAAGRDASRPLNVVLVFGDQWRAQAFGYAGDSNVRTPHIDRLEARSVNLQNAVSGCPVRVAAVSRCLAAVPRHNTCASYIGVFFYRSAARCAQACSLA
eukprot:COSAG06_NODE_13965_length_1201_cov_8.503630_1_plen_150_part_10